MSRKMSRIVSGIMLSVLSRIIFRVMSRKMPRIVSGYQKMQNSIKNDSRKNLKKSVQCRGQIKVIQKSQSGKTSVHLKMLNYQKCATKNCKTQLKMIRKNKKTVLS